MRCRATPFLIVALVAACRKSSLVPAEAVDTSAPQWYQSTELPWKRLPLEARADLVRMHDSMMASDPPREVRIVEGRHLLRRIAKNYGLRDSVQTSVVDGREIVWVPEDVWLSMLAKDQESIKTYAGSRSAKWGIGYGPVSNGRIVESQVVFRH
ncbi:MAG TPA: hypothetical protein VJ865_07810 [Gemmatimonadaceae bacterium]|nr:hypothetical protein [Gemmatimonadaceae bacterium]